MNETAKLRMNLEIKVLFFYNAPLVTNFIQLIILLTWHPNPGTIDLVGETNR
jgi:hypothetical protein